MKKVFLLYCLFELIGFPIKAQDFNMTFRSEVVYPTQCASIWGYVDSLGNEYALVGTLNGVSIVDISDADNPVVLFNVEHTPSAWRELKTYGHYCYATNESGGGLLIIDLSNLPASYQQYSFKYEDTDGHVQESGHTLWIDESGKLFIFGGWYSSGGATIFDLTTDPLNPPYLGKYEEHYIHDGFVRGDTLWASEISDGQLELVDVSNPLNPIPMASQHTPSNFTHNSWPTHDNHYVFTADEVDNAYLTSYDVSDLANIKELDRVQSNPGSQSIIHNVHLYNDQFAMTAYYKDGVVIFDVSHPDNMIEVASYDTDTLAAGGGYGGAWGVYPWLPSGNILVSDYIDAGTNTGKLTVLTPTLVSGCWLEGLVTDTLSGTPLNNAFVDIVGTSESDQADLSGIYKTGTGVSGTYTVRFSKPGYFTKEIPNVVLSNGAVNVVDVQLIPLTTSTVTGTVFDSITNTPVAGAQVFLRGLQYGFDYNITTDVNGAFSVSPVFEDFYDLFVGKWGYHENGIYNTYLDSNTSPLQFPLAPGYYDDFILDQGWMVSGSAQLGMWEYGEPVGTFDGSIIYNPDEDLTGDWGDYCYVTGNGGGAPANDEVDKGKTYLTSPVFDVSTYTDPVVSFYAWFANGDGSGTPNDTLLVNLQNGSNSITVEKIKSPTSQWVYHEFHINEYMTPSANMEVKFEASDLNFSLHIVEAAIDVFRIDNGLGTGETGLMNFENDIKSYPNPFTQESILTYDFNNDDFKEGRLEVYNVLGILVEEHLFTTSRGIITWGASLESGVFFQKIIVDGKAVRIIPSVKIK